MSMTVDDVMDRFDRPFGAGVSLGDPNNDCTHLLDLNNALDESSVGIIPNVERHQNGRNSSHLSAHDFIRDRAASGRRETNSHGWNGIAHVATSTQVVSQARGKILV
jgi:hypothetical protein